MKPSKYTLYSVIFLAIFCVLVWGVISILLVHLETLERSRLKVWAMSYREVANTTNLQKDIDFAFRIMTRYNDIPLLLVDDKGQIVSMQNFSDVKPADPEAVEILEEIRAYRDPIEIVLPHGIIHYVYYYQRPMFGMMRYVPFVVFIMGVVLTFIIYWQLSIKTQSRQNALWISMAKETAHQIATPLSALLGWVQLLSIRSSEESAVKESVVEMKKDLDRLEVVAQRFSSIGFDPVFEVVDIVRHTKEQLSYLELRSTVAVKFQKLGSGWDVPVYARLNVSLYAWVLENLIKNAIDSMKGKGKVTFTALSKGNYFVLNVKDTGEGVPKKLWKRIFVPGYTTKKTGWGMGLSLCKRIVEKYHNGRISIVQSKLGFGTVFSVRIPVHRIG